MSAPPRASLPAAPGETGAAPGPAPPSPIDPSMTIRAVLARYPQTRAVFERNGLAGCGGPAGPAEPLDQFARLHHVDVTRLLAELTESVQRGGQNVAAPSPPAPTWESYRLYLKTSLALALTAGFGVGLLAVLARVGGPSLGAYWLPLIQAHGQVQLLGWVGLFVVGVAYHVVPRFVGAAPPSRRLALATYGLLLGSVLVRAVAQPLAVVQPLPGVYTLAALLQLGASGLFAATLLRWLLPRRARWEGYEPYLVAAGIWLVLAALLEVGIAVAADAAGSAIVASALSNAYLYAMFYGFALLAALGVTRRAIPLFMGLRSTSEPWAGRAGLALQLAIVLGVGARLGLGLTNDSAWRLAADVGALLAFGAAAAYVAALHLFERAPMAPGPGQPRGHEPFIRTAHAWLLLTLGLGAALALRELVWDVPPSASALVAERHALALGFLSLLIFGMASRIVPVFGGVPLWRPRLLVPLYVVFNLGVALRVAGELMGNRDDLARGLVAVSGLLGFLGLTLFALILWRTLDQRPRVALPLVANPRSPAAGVPPATPSPHHAVHGPGAATDSAGQGASRGATTLPPADGSQAASLLAPTQAGVGAAITADWTVAAVLERWPATLATFLAFGFAPLANPVLRQALAPRVTLAQAAAMRQVDLAALLVDLERAASAPERDPAAG